MYYSMNPYRRYNEFPVSPFFRSVMDGMNMLPGHVKEKEESFEIEAVLPGIDPENINISVREDTLTISVEPPKRADGCENSDGHAPRGYCRGPRLLRSYDLEGIDKDDITAAYRNGIVYITLPKLKKTEEARRIALTVDAPQAMTVNAE